MGPAFTTFDNSLASPKHVPPGFVVDCGNPNHEVFDMEQLAGLIAAFFLASSAVQENPKAPTPRAAIEQAAYVEEHERDFEKAVGLYAEAELEARKAGDEGAAIEAAAAKRRLEARIAGKQDPAVTEQQSEAVVNRIGELLQSLERYSSQIGSQSPGWADYSSNSSDLSVYGAAAVPWLESLLEPSPEKIGDYVVSMDTKLAARLLSELATGAGSEALGRALSSKDPLIRRAVADHMSAERHRALLERAATDPVPQVRSAAISKLLGLDDPALQPLVEREALRGDYKAVQWLARHASERLLELAGSPDVGAGIVNYSFKLLAQAKTLPPTQRAASELLRLSRELPDVNHRNNAIEALLLLLQKPWDGAPDSQRAFIQEQILNGPEDFPKPGVYSVLGQVGDMRALEFLAKEHAREEEGRTKNTRIALSKSIVSVLRGTQPRDFEALVRLYGEIPIPAGARPSLTNHHEWILSRLGELTERGGIPASTLARGYDGLEGLLKQSYLGVANRWLASQPPLKDLDDDVWNVSESSLDAALIPILRDLLNGHQSYKVMAIGGIYAAGDIDSLHEILRELTTSRYARLANIAEGAAHRFADANPRRVSELIGEAIRNGISPGVLRVLDAPYDLELFKSLWTTSKEADARVELLSALIGHVSGKEADALIVEHYHAIPESYARVRKNAIVRFGEHLYEPAISILGSALGDPNAGVRVQARKAFQAFKQHREALEEFAAWTLGDRQARAQINELTALLESPDSQIVIGAVKALGAVRARSALPALVRLLQREEQAVRTAVHEAIERIGQ